MSAIDDIYNQLADDEENFDDYTTQNDDDINNIGDQISDHDDSINDLQQDSGQLTFPLSQDSIDLIKSVFPTGFVKLGSSPIITNPAISATSVIMLTRVQALGTLGQLSYGASAGQAVVGSSSGMDSSLVAYVIFN
jgi:hypothetical protein